VLLRYCHPFCLALESLLSPAGRNRCSSAPSQVTPLLHGYAVWEHTRQGYATIGSIAQRLCIRVPLQIMWWPWRAVAALCAHGSERWTSYQCAVTRKLYVVAGYSDGIHAIGATEAVRTLEAMLHCKAGPSVACGHGCMPMVATGSCCMLGLGMLCGWCVSSDATALPTVDLLSESLLGPLCLCRGFESH
jgi:hypothetical protein